MKNGNERIAVVGAGALGGHVGGYLAKHGANVLFIDPWPAHVDKLNANGLELAGLTPAECFTARVPAIHLTELQREAHGPGFDIVFLAVKSYDTRWAATMIAPYLAKGGFIVSLQNGINEPEIADVVGWPRTVGCIATKISVELVEPGKIQRNIALGAGGSVIFQTGETHGRITPRVERVAALLKVVDTSQATSNLWGERWSKLGVNCMRNALAAVTGRGGNDNDRDPVSRRLAIRVAGEAVRVGRAQGYDISKLYGMAADDLELARDGDAAALERCEDVILEAVKTRSDRQRPSMGQDIAKGRRTEIDHLNGLVVREARRVNVPTPRNAALVDLVHRIERGAVTPSPDLVADIA